jgi:hypothetical protein
MAKASKVNIPDTARTRHTLGIASRANSPAIANHLATDNRADIPNSLRLTATRLPITKAGVGLEAHSNIRLATRPPPQAAEQRGGMQTVTRTRRIATLNQFTATVADAVRGLETVMVVRAAVSHLLSRILWT